MTDNRIVVGVFSEESEAIQAMQQLMEIGFGQDEISVLAEEPERFSVRSNINVQTPHDINRGAATGAITGSVVVGFGALIAQLGALAIPGIGPVLALGPIAAVVTGLVAGGAVGGALGALLGLGINKEEAKLYEQNLKNGDILVIVEAANDQYEAAAKTLHRTTGPRSIVQSIDEPEAAGEAPRFAAGSDEAGGDDGSSDFNK